MSSLSPLAEQLRPKDLQEVVGQEHLLEEGKPLSNMLKNDKIYSMILWGPPGSGKTTLAQLLAQKGQYEFIALSAVFSGVADLKKIFTKAEELFQNGKQTLLFIDEIHRFNRTQQDTFLPYVEKGVITLIGATTENPSFSLNKALLSRCQLFVLKRLEAEALSKILERAERYFKRELLLSDEAKQLIFRFADGDGRAFISMLDILFTQPTSQQLTEEEVANLLLKRAPIYDKTQEEHYNLISALHKCIRGSDPDAALYWFARMLEGGEDPLYITRRLIRAATEDIGMADPQALVQATIAAETYERLGSHEGELAIAQAVVYLATAPKSNAIYLAFKEAKKAVSHYGSLMPPQTILNAPTAMMNNLGYGKGYIYDHDTREGFSGQNYFPETMSRHVFYEPVERGFEREIKKRLEYWQKLRLEKKFS